MAKRAFSSFESPRMALSHVRKTSRPSRKWGVQVVKVAPVRDLVAVASAIAQLPLVVGEIVRGESIAPEDPIVESRHGACLQHVEVGESVDFAGERLIRDVLPYPGSDCKLDAAHGGELDQLLDRVLSWSLLPVVLEQHSVEGELLHAAESRYQAAGPARQLRASKRQIPAVSGGFQRYEETSARKAETRIARQVSAW
jgi:hypothetical protein